jgi:hypothetical protein
VLTKNLSDLAAVSKTALGHTVAPLTGGGARRDQNGGEHAGVEEAEVLRLEVVDRLKHELQKIGLHLLGSFGWRENRCGLRRFCTESVKVTAT